MLSIVGMPLSEAARLAIAQALHIKYRLQAFLAKIGSEVVNFLLREFVDERLDIWSDWIAIHMIELANLYRIHAELQKANSI